MKKYIAYTLASLLTFSLFADDVILTNLKEGGKELNTVEIQKSIDSCSASGGGKVIFPSGVYKTGFIVMKDNVSLQLADDTIILGSENASDYPQLQIPTADADFNYTLIYAKEAKNISINGGTIRGQGEKFPRKGEAARHRPRNILFDTCKNVKLTNCTMLNPAFWNAFFLHCDGVEIDRVRIYAHANQNNDGIDIASKNVRITNCVINSTDDSICFKNEHSQDFVVENIYVENCLISSACNFIKIGTGTQSDFKNIKIKNCTLSRPSDETHWRWNWKNFGIKEGEVVGLAGIALEAVDGGSIKNIEISNISMTGIQTPIFIRVDCRDRNNKTGKKSSLDNVLIENVNAVSDSWITSSITAPQGYVLQNVKIKNCMFNIRGGAPEEFINNKIPEPKKAYPENRMFGRPLPSYAFFIRNVKNLTFSNIQVLTHLAPEFRHAIYAENAENLIFENTIIQKPAGKAETFKFVNTTPKWIGSNIQR